MELERLRAIQAAIKGLKPGEPHTLHLPLRLRHTHAQGPCGDAGSGAGAHCRPYPPPRRPTLRVGKGDAAIAACVQELLGFLGVVTTPEAVRAPGGGWGAVRQRCSSQV